VTSYSEAFGNSDSILLQHALSAEAASIAVYDCVGGGCVILLTLTLAVQSITINTYQPVVSLSEPYTTNVQLLLLYPDKYFP
jgi:hypothetical protein